MQVQKNSKTLKFQQCYSAIGLQLLQYKTVQKIIRQTIFNSLQGKQHILSLSIRS